MQVMITRPTVVRPVGEDARAVEVNAVLVVDDEQGRKLVQLGKAIEWRAAAGAPETATAAAQGKRSRTAVQ